MDIPNYTGFAWAGENYAQTKGTDIKDIAKLIRQDIKNAFPELKVSVRIQRYAGGQSLHVSVLESPEPLHNPNFDYDLSWERDAGVKKTWTDEELNKIQRYTERGETVRDALEEIVKSYRRDDSDGMIDYFDTNFYGFVDIEGDV